MDTERTGGGGEGGGGGGSGAVERVWGGQGREGRGEHERPRQEKGARSGWVRA